MFYYYFRFFNWIGSFFGLRKPFSSLDARRTCISKITLNKLWSLCILISVIVTHLLLVDLTLKFDIKNNLDEISSINNILTNAFIILINVTNSEKLYAETYETINVMLSDLKLSNRSIMMMSIKLYIWFSIQILIFLIFIIMEFVFGDPPFVMIVRIPLFLSMYHLFIHLCLILSILKIINIEMIDMLKLQNKDACKIFFMKSQRARMNFFYFLDKNIYFIHPKPTEKIHLPFMCKIYDDLCSCIHLLQKCHELEILLILWLMFTTAVTSITLISNDETQHPWLEVLKGVQIYFWFIVECHVDGQIRQEVEKTDLLIIKNMIDFRCDPVRRGQLQLFKQVVNTNRLQFKACNLYRLNYSTVLGTILSVITYSIISIQLF